MTNTHNPIRTATGHALAGFAAMAMAMMAWMAADVAALSAHRGGSMVADSVKTHVVSAGETLFSISRRHGVSVEQLRTWNDLEGATLGIGMELVVADPFHPIPSGDAAGVASGIASVPSAPQIAASPSSTGISYVVRAGDTLFGIARRFDVTVQQLRERNRLTSDDLHVGQTLTIRTVPSTPSLAQASASPEAPPSAPQGRFTLHTLRQGERVMETVRRFGMDSTEFAALNPGIDASSLRAGQSITVLLPQNRVFPNPYRRSAPSLDTSEAWVTAYPPSHRAMPTASGELHDPGAFTAGHSSLPLGSLVMLQHPQNSLSVLVRINDRVPGGTLRVSQAVVDFLRLTPDSAAGAPAGGNVRYRAIVGRADVIAGG